MKFDLDDPAIIEMGLMEPLGDRYLVLYHPLAEHYVFVQL